MTGYEGLVLGLKEDVYHSQPEVSSTGAKALIESAAHYRHYVQTPREPKASFDLGSLAHSRVLGVGPGLAIYPDGKGDEVFEFEGETLTSVLSSAGTRGSKACKAFEADARERGFIPMKRADAVVVEAMVESVLGDPDARKLLESGDPEVSMFATDPDTDVPMRGRLDWLGGGRIIDLKTTSKGSSEAEFEVVVNRLLYDVQAAWYEHLYYLITGDTLPYLFIVVETAPPFFTGIHRLSEDHLKMGRTASRVARKRYARAVETGEWPKPPNRDGGPIGVVRPTSYRINHYYDLMREDT